MTSALRSVGNDRLQNPERIPPQSLLAEMHVLGSCMIYPEHYTIANEIIGASDFYALAHETIWRAIAGQVREGKPCDAIAIGEILRAVGKLELVGDFASLRSMSRDIVATEASTRYYATLVREKSLLRNLIVAGLQIAEHGYEGETDVERAIANSEQALRLAVEGGLVGSPGTSMHAALERNADLVLNAKAGRLGAQRTPFPRLNHMIGALYPGMLCIWTAAAKMGKTAMLATVTRFLAQEHGRVNFHSLEMGIDALVARFIAQQTGISAKRQMLGDLSGSDMQKLAAARLDLDELRISIFDRSDTPRLADVRKAARAAAAREQLAAVVIDHVGYLDDFESTGSSKADSHLTEAQRLERIYKRCKIIAEESQCVVHAVVHVNRDGQSGGPPTLRNIRGGGNPDGHAHVVLSPYRPDPNGETAEARSQGELIVLATREGDAGSVPMEFVGYKALWIDASDPTPWFQSTVLPNPQQSLDDFEEVF